MGIDETGKAAGQEGAVSQGMEAHGLQGLYTSSGSSGWVLRWDIGVAMLGVTHLCSRHPFDQTPTIPLPDGKRPNRGKSLGLSLFFRYCLEHGPFSVV